MKKNFFAAMVTALTLGSTSITFAANPFSDLPKTHWAYKSISDLAQAGIVEGYGDGTFRGSQDITRYEMAQMTAKALARVEESGEQIDPALQTELEKLVREFHDELKTLGVRVDDLKDHSDFVNWTGELRYLYWSNRDEDSNGRKTKANTNRFELRLFPTVTISDHWKGKARLTARNDMSNDSTTDVSLTYIYAEGKYGDFGINIGKMSNYSYNDEGLTTDHFFSGVQLTYGKKIQGIFEAGRWNLNSGGNSDISSAFADDSAANYWGLQVNYNGDRAFAGIGYRQFKGDGFKNLANYSNDNDKDSARILSIGANYRFGNVTLAGAYARNTKADNFKTSHNISLSYKGANRNKPNSWGIYAAYRYISPFVSLAPTYDTMGFRNNRKGWEGGLTYTPFKNIVTSVSYFKGKQLDGGNDSDTLWARARFWF